MSDMLPSVPHNPEAEQAVLGAMLVDNSVICNVVPLLSADDFYAERHGWLYQAIVDMFNNGIAVDVITLSAELERRKQLAEVGGTAYIMELISVMPTSIHAEHYARLVADASLLRNLIRASSQIAQLAYEQRDGSASQIVDKAEQIILSVGAKRRFAAKPMFQVVNNVVDQIDALYRRQSERYIPGVPSGFAPLDSLLGGFQRGDMIVLAARPSMGKTSLALSMAWNAVRRYGCKVAVFSMEMSAEQVVQRLLAIESGIGLHRLRVGQIDGENEWHKIITAADVVQSAPMYIDDTPVLTAVDLRARARRLYAEHGIDLVIVDYLQLMVGERRFDNRVQEITSISRSLKELARELDIPVIAVSQLSRAVEGRQDKRPVLADLRDSGSIEQDADVVMFLYREEVYKPGTGNENIADVIVAKHRNGPIGQVSVYFKKELAQFCDLVVYKEEVSEAQGTGLGARAVARAAIPEGSGARGRTPAPRASQGARGSEEGGER